MVKVAYLLPKTRPDAEVNEVLNSRWSELIIVNGYPGEWPRNKWSTNDLSGAPYSSRSQGSPSVKTQISGVLFFHFDKTILSMMRKKDIFFIKHFQPLLRHSNLQFSILGRSLLLGRLVVNISSRKPMHAGTQNILPFLLLKMEASCFIQVAVWKSLGEPLFAGKSLPWNIQPLANFRFQPILTQAWS